MEVIILTRRDFREYDQIITYYSKEFGKGEGLAKGVKRIVAKNSANLEPFTVLDIEVTSGKKHQYITKAYPVEIFEHIRKDSKKILLGGFILFIGDALIGLSVRDPKIYELIYTSLKEIDSLKKLNNYFTDSFLIRLSSLLGFSPVLYQCSHCGKKDLDKFFFSNKEGGVLCATCSKGEGEITSGTVAVMRNYYSGDQKNENIKDKERAHDLIIKFIQFHSGVRIPDWGPLLNRN